MVYYQLLAILLLGSCVAAKSTELKSSWKALRDAKPMSCSRITLDDQHIGINDALLVKSKSNTGVILKARTRKGRDRFYSFEIDSDLDLLSPGKLIPAIETNSSLSGASGEYWATTKTSEPDGKDEVSFSIWTYPGGRNLSTHKFNSMNIERMTLGGSTGSSSITTEANQKYTILPIKSFNRHQSKEKPTSPHYTSKPLLVTSNKNSRQFFISKNQDSKNKRQESGFKFEVKMNIKGHQNDTSISLDFPRLDNIEQWSASGHNAGFYLAVLAGDSFFGEADVYLSSYRYAGNRILREWMAKFKLEDAYAGAFEWLNKGNSTQELIFLSWLDEEATLNAFRLDRSRAYWLKNRGVFESGTTLLGVSSLTFKDGHSQSIILARYRNKLNWEYKLCKVPLPVEARQ